MFDLSYLVEILTPKSTDPADSMEKLNQFAERYYRVLDSGLGFSFPDNPMGQPRSGLLKTIEKADLPVVPDRTVMNLNTFHEKKELDEILRKAMETGIKYLLVIRGDGGPLLPKLDPQSIGGARNVATSIDLLRHINTTYKDKFITGSAYNQYNPMPFEQDRLKEKKSAGAQFVITQPVIGKDPNIDSILDLGIPIVIEAWMSMNLDLLFKSVRKKKDEHIKDYDPVINLRTIHNVYPDSCVYLSMLGFKKQWRAVLPKF